MLFFEKHDNRSQQTAPRCRILMNFQPNTVVV